MARNSDYHYEHRFANHCLVLPIFQVVLVSIVSVILLTISFAISPAISLPSLFLVSRVISPRYCSLRHFPCFYASFFVRFWPILASVFASFLVQIFAHIMNLSINSETVPKSFKEAKVLTLFKKGSKLDPGNYWPVSILSVLYKILERALYSQLSEYLDKRGIFFRCAVASL